MATFACNRHNVKSHFLYLFMVQLQASPKGRRGAIGAGRTVYDLLRAQIANGTLPAGARVMSTRGLAAELGVSRTTVTAAYEQLAAEGYLVTATGRAARVATPSTAVPPLRLSANRCTQPAPKLSKFGSYLRQMGMPALP